MEESEGYTSSQIESRERESQMKNQESMRELKSALEILQGENEEKDEKIRQLVEKIEEVERKLNLIKDEDSRVIN